MKSCCKCKQDSPMHFYKPLDPSGPGKICWACKAGGHGKGGRKREGGKGDLRECGFKQANGASFKSPPTVPHARTTLHKEPPSHCPHLHFLLFAPHFTRLSVQSLLEVGATSWVGAEPTHPIHLAGGCHCVKKRRLQRYVADGRSAGGAPLPPQRRPRLRRLQRRRPRLRTAQGRQTPVRSSLSLPSFDA